jgi:hypothetical protein
LISSLGTDERFDLQCALMSLPLRFGTDLTNIPAKTPYLRADPERAAHWREKIGSEGFRIGICWHTKPLIVNHSRTFPLQALFPLSQIPGVRLISLQKHYGLEQLAAIPADMKVDTLGSAFDSGPDAFLDTAAAMESLDLIVTCDTAIAHLAGALARPVWLPLKYVPDWRWLLHRSDSPWYPTMRLFRQQNRGDWSNVFQEITAELERLIAERAPRERTLSRAASFV